MCFISIINSQYISNLQANTQLVHSKNWSLKKVLLTKQFDFLWLT